MELSGKNALELSAKAAMISMLAVLVALTCLSGAEASAKEQATATSTNKNLGTKLKGIEVVAGVSSVNAFGSASYTRFRNNNCKFRPSICLNRLVPGSACCGVACVDLHSHSGHCGSCNHICRVGHSCCSGKCKSLSRDRNHCGFCNNKCPFGSRCAYGLCGY